MKNESKKRPHVRWLLAFYDCLIIIACSILFFVIYGKLGFGEYMAHLGISLVILYVVRGLFSIYSLIWRFGGIRCYLRLIVCDMVAFIAYYIFERVIPFDRKLIFPILFGYVALILLLSLSMRMIYRYAYKCCRSNTKIGEILLKLAAFFSRSKISDEDAIVVRTNIAIIGAGRVGTALAEDLLSTINSPYIPRMFIDINQEKVGRKIFNLPVYDEEDITQDVLDEQDIREVILAVQTADEYKRRNIYEFYRNLGRTVKIYDYPLIESSANGKKIIRDFDIEELLFRKPIELDDELTNQYYSGKVIMITGGGGSIGSELCRQIAKMEPKKLIIVDICENGAYDIQQELKIKYGDKIDLNVEILSVCNRVALERVFAKYEPQIVLNAAAHKHVPLMENNPIEAIENNVFGTLNTAVLSEKYGVEHFIMVSTDKAVNPTNVMGATKRMCEIIIQSMSVDSDTVFSATRFGNVLGSAGSVIPLFKKQIANGGPVTITDKRIIRYFMTIPEASELVLTSGRMAQSGELFVLDMGKPVKIVELAENMIRLSGRVPYTDIDIVEVGLRPGEKLYEELLIKSEDLTMTDNELIFIERDDPIDADDLCTRLEKLRRAVASGDQSVALATLHEVVPTFKTPDEVNMHAEEAREMAQV